MADPGGVRLWNSGTREAPLAWMGSLVRLIHGAAGKALLSSLGKETELPLRVKHTVPLLTPASGRDWGRVCVAPAVLLGFTSAQADAAKHSVLYWGWPCVYP